MPPATEESDWSYLRRSSSKDDDIVKDAGAPSSPPNALRIVFTTDMQRDHEPSVHFISLPKVTEIYAGWWMKLSPNWTCSPAGCGKITFLFPESANGGVIYSNLAGTNGSHYVDVATTWQSTGYKFWQPNVTQTRVDNDRWYQVEWYVKWASHADATDGIVRWWVNGELNGDYRNVPFPAIRGFVEFQHASTRQDPPPTEQYMYIDHTYVRYSGPADEAAVTRRGAILCFHSITTPALAAEGSAHVPADAFKSFVRIARRLGELVPLSELVRRDVTRPEHCRTDRGDI